MTPLIRSLPVLILCPHARCNCRCVMCDIWKETSQSELTAEELAQHLADIEKLSVKWVVFSGGEPLMHSDLFRLSDMLRSRNIRVTLLSTGLLLKRYAQQIVTRIDDVIVSLDGPAHIHDQIRRVPGAFAQLEQGIRAIHDLDPDYPISARCTIQRMNYSWPQRNCTGRKTLGAQRNLVPCCRSYLRSFQPIPTVGGLSASSGRSHLDEVWTLQRELENVDEDWHGSGFVAENAEKLRRISDHFRAHLGLVRAQAPRCNAPWVSAVVEANGTVRPCFFHPPIGSLKSQTLLQVVNGFEAQQFRGALDVATNPVCARCVCSLNWK